MSTPLPISKLISMIGDENITIQNLARDFTGGRNMKDHGIITFATSRDMCQQMMRQAAGIKATHVGLILWVPSEKIDEVNAANPISA